MDYWGGKNYFVFVGDTRTEQLYHAFIHQITPSFESSRKTGIEQKARVQRLEDDFLYPPNKLLNQDMVYNDSELGLKIQFLWQPYANKSMISALQQWKVTELVCG